MTCPEYTEGNPALSAQRLFTRGEPFGPELRVEGLVESIENPKCFAARQKSAEYSLRLIFGNIKKGEKYELL